MILEGCYPYVRGGVSSWMHEYIQGMPEHEFVLWVIGAKAEDKGKFKYELPRNVAEIHEVFLDDALRLRPTGKENSGRRVKQTQGEAPAKADSSPSSSSVMATV